MLRLNMAIPPTSRPSVLGVLDGDLAGFPNGRRLTDDVVDIALRAMAGATPLTPDFNAGINAGSATASSAATCGSWTGSHTWACRIPATSGKANDDQTAEGLADATPTRGRGDVCRAGGGRRRCRAENPAVAADAVGHRAVGARGDVALDDQPRRPVAGAGDADRARGGQCRRRSGGRGAGRRVDAPGARGRRRARCPGARKLR